MPRGRQAGRQAGRALWSLVSRVEWTIGRHGQALFWPREIKCWALRSLWWRETRKAFAVHIYLHVEPSFIITVSLYSNYLPARDLNFHRMIYYWCIFLGQAMREIHLVVYIFGSEIVTLGAPTNNGSPCVPAWNRRNARPPSFLSGVLRPRIQIKIIDCSCRSLS